MSKNIPNPPAIGQNVKKQRLEQNMSLEKLARKSGVSKAMLSQIESEKVNPTIATMWKIAHALKSDFNLLLKGEGERVRKFHVNRHEDLTSLDTDCSGVHINVLSPISMAEDLELYTLTLQPGGKLDSSPHYRGTEEFLTVLTGSVKVTAGDKSTILNEGDLINFDCDVEHSIENAAEEVSMAYLVVRFSK
ncbi:XRE family transcriptional regulator [Lentisphaerota bacterium ZTH]|nr:helix-turn-helix transcriptional regulator [Lentisphaerota bacterium]WET05666.1 XRE family transcriptional regulator [Lentisphaerota bacterium ZTH]